MEFLKIPDLFKGEWENLLIMSYGANIPFFENSLWRQFSNRCRNKIILADASQHLTSCLHYADRGWVRLLNQRYIVEKIFIPQSAHAKFILLTNHEKGRLLVGSGNLSIDGYASGGELFTQYEYSEKTEETLPEFLSIWEFVEGLLSRNYIGQDAIPYLQHLHTQTPWLFKPGKSNFNQVRHNLTKSFLAQIQEAIGNEEVEELWIASPFYDEKAFALRQLLRALSPKEVNLLVQADRTSLDPDALTKVLNEFSGKVRIYSIDLKDSTNTYIHAKLYLVKTKKAAVCLQGSPNLSQVAMLLTPPAGNIELANLSVGGRNDFDFLLENLNLQPVSQSVHSLNLSFNKPEEGEEKVDKGWHLVGGVWQENKLVIRFRGEMPALSNMGLVIGTEVFPAQVVNYWEDGLEILLPNEARALLTSPNPVSITFGDGRQSNPVFVINTSALNREMLDTSLSGEQIGHIGDLDLDDDELEGLLSELESALVIDRRSVWQMAGRNLPKVIDDDEALKLDYADINYEQLRHHPKILSYVSSIGGKGQSYYTKSRLQIILGAITDHFNGLVDITYGTSALNITTPSIDMELAEIETEAESEEEETEKQKHQKTSAARIRQLWKNFIKRYLRGLKSPDFQELVGFDVMANNYIVFSHILWRLYSKDWVEPEFILESFLQTLRFFWGDNKKKGYFFFLEDADKGKFLQLMKEHKSQGLLLSAIHYGAYLSFVSGWETLRFSLRDFLRGFLTMQPFVIDNSVIEEAWHFTGSLFPYNPPIPSRMITELERLANFENQRGFLSSIEIECGYKEGSCSIIKQDVYREHLQDSAKVDCLLIVDPKAVQSLDEALLIVSKWQKYSPRDYYRIMSGDSLRIFLFDEKTQDGLFFQKDINKITPVRELLQITSSIWEKCLEPIKQLAGDIDKSISLNFQVVAKNDIS